MDLVLGLVVGLLIGAVAGAAVMAVRARQEAQRRQVAVDAELQAARQRAERAIGEAQALRMRLVAAGAVAGQGSVEVPPPVERARAPEVPSPVSAPPRPTRRVRPAEPVVAATPVVDPVTPSERPTAMAPVVAVAASPTPVAPPQPPAPATEVPESPPADATPRDRPARSRSTKPAVPPPDTGWRPLRPGLSDPHTWLGQAAPNGTRYAQDDLERIHGVGPYLARRLRDEGVLTWRQIAEWNDEDMALVSRRIGSFPDRVRREDWPGSARALHAEVYGETLP